MTVIGKIITLVFILPVLFTVWAPGAQGKGILTPFVESSVRDITPGREYRISDTDGRKLRVKNTSESTVTVEIRVIKPTPDRVSEGRIPIPDTGWIYPEQERIEIEPGEGGETDLIINIPRERENYGKDWEAAVITSTTGRGLIQAALRSRVYINTAERTGLWGRFKGIFGL